MADDLPSIRSHSHHPKSGELATASFQFSLKDLLLLVGLVAGSLALGRLTSINPSNPSGWSITLLGSVVSAVVLAPTLVLLVGRRLRGADSARCLRTSDRVLLGVVVATIAGCVAAGWPGVAMLFFLITAWPWQILFYFAWRQEQIRTGGLEDRK